jgi:K+-sensing histidine kinase KdpD
MLKDPNDELYVVHVVKENWKYFGTLKESDALDYLYEISKEYGANLSIVKGKDIEAELAKFAKKQNVDIIVMGESMEEQEQQNMIKRLKGKIDKEVTFEVIPLED